jgi:hypothetical protein
MANSTRRSTVLRVVLAMSACALLAVAPAPAALASTDVEDLASGVTPADLAQALAGPGVSVSNVEFVGTDGSAALFTETDPALFGFAEGVVLSTGLASDIVGPNQFSDLSTPLGTPGDTQLTGLAGYPTLDATVLSFDFVPIADTVYISYVFASEEYNEYANQEFNDVFAFFVNGENCAVTDSGQAVSVNTINGGNPDDGSAAVRPDLYRDNTDGTLNAEPDGFTVVLVCNAGVRPNEVNTMRLAIADGSDDQWDSWVLLAAQGITTEAPIVPLRASLAVAEGPARVGDPVTVTATIENPNEVDEEVDRLLVDLPDGLQYVSGSTTGAGDPEVVGSTLQFAQGSVIPAGGRLEFAFAVTPSVAGTETIAISGDTASGAVIVAGAVEVTVEGSVVDPAALAPVVGVTAGVVGVIILAGAVAAVIATNTPRARQRRLLRKHVRLMPRQDTTGRQTARPTSDAPAPPAFRLVPRPGTVEHHAIEEDRP